MSSLSLSKKRRLRENELHLQSESEAPDSKKRCNSTQGLSTTGNSLLSNSQLNINNSIRCGKVLRMHLTNFMCHSNLCIEFHPRINFLVGSNGSGKSAVMAALVLALGGNARATNRSTNLKKLIKSNENSAKIEISISNEGSQAFEVDTYGNRITIVRTINQSSSNYSIKNARGQIISRKAEDLHRILMYHNVQVDNPVFVLSQDNAREFLKDLDPKKNYKLFLKATQIELIMEKLNDCILRHQEHTYSMQCFQKKIKKNREDCQGLKRRLTQLLSLEKLKDDLRVKELQRHWVLVTKLEGDLQKLQDSSEKLEQKKATIMSAVTHKEKIEIALTQKISDLDRKIQQNRDLYCVENGLYLEKNNKVKQLTHRFSEIEASVDGYKKRLSALETEIQDLTTHIEDRSKQNIDNVTQMREENDNKLQELRSLKHENTALIANTKRDLQLFQENRVQIKKQLSELEHRKSDYVNNINHIDARIANIKASSKDKLSIYGNHVSHLLADIESYNIAGKFTEAPRGPIGRYIEVPSPKYRDVVENQIGALAHGFIVSCTKDRLTLESLLKKYPTYRPTIITTKFIKQVYDVHKGCVIPPRDTRRLMDEIKCSDPVVMNCLIDRVRIETILLTDLKRTAEHFTSNRENVPDNLQKVIVPEVGLEIFPDPHYRMYAISIRPAQVIQISTEERIKQLEIEKLNLQEKVEATQNEYAAMIPKLQADAKRIQDIHMQMQRLTVEQNDVQEKMFELENIEYADFNQLDILRNDLAENGTKLNILKEKFNIKKKELTEVLNEKEHCELELNQQKSVMQSIQMEIDNIQRTCDKAQMEMQNLSERFSQNESKLQEVNNLLQEMQKTVKRISQEIDKAVKNALQHGARIPCELTEDEILADIQALQAKIKMREKSIEDPQKLSELIEAKEQSIKVDQMNFDKTEVLIRKLKHSLIKRINFLKRLKQHMILMMQYKFDECLKLRSFSGAIEFDQEEKTLTISVVPRVNQDNIAVSTTKALSGGERSYSTVAFLISLWACVDHPFYFLDEYDVFTDEVNREYMTHLLICEGKSHPNRQYTFLTPQDMSLTSRDIIKIHSLGEKR